MRKLTFVVNACSFLKDAKAAADAKTAAAMVYLRDAKAAFAPLDGASANFGLSSMQFHSI